jgi:osmotically-inducible protein OsmY
MRALTLAGGVFVAVAFAAGCSDRTEQKAREAGQETAEAARAAGETVESAADDALKNTERASDAAVNAAGDARHQAADAVEQASRRTDDAEASLKQTGRSAEQTVNDAAAATGAALQTAQVKAALIADSKVDASGIDVDTDAQAKTVTLNGHVPSATQKSLAGRIAEAKVATGYRVRNELVVHP